MKAVITKPANNGRNYGNEKELVGAYTVHGRINGEMREVVTARAYMGRSRNSSMVYASIWVHAPDVCTSGHDTAGGYGYHKESAAFEGAISKAGIELYGPVSEIRKWDANLQREKTDSEMRAEKRKAAKQRAYIGGVGASAMREAFEAIARAAGARGKLIFTSH